MAYSRRDIRGGAVQTTITAGISSNDTSCAIAASTGWPDGSTNGSFYVVIDPGLATEEKILCSTRSTLTVNFTTRGADGSTASAHASGAVIYPIITAVDADEANYAVSKTVGKVAAAGDLLVGDGTNSLTKLAKGSSSTVLGVDSGGTLGYTTVTSAMITDGTIVNADISSSAAIAYSKLALTGAVLNADLAGSIAYSKLALTGAILNADLAGSIAYSKLSLTGAILNGDLAGSIAVSKTLLTAGNGLTLSTNTLAVDDTIVNTGAWTTVTPTLTQSGAVTKTVNYAAYERVGRMIHFAGKLTVTGSGTANNVITVSLPVNAAQSNNEIPIGVGNLVDSSSPARYLGHAFLNSASTIAFFRTDSHLQSGRIGIDPNYGLQANDIVAWTVSYEAAS